VRKNTVEPTEKEGLEKEEIVWERWLQEMWEKIYPEEQLDL
jgi:hypothetical protein